MGHAPPQGYGSSGPATQLKFGSTTLDLGDTAPTDGQVVVRSGDEIAGDDAGGVQVFERAHIAGLVLSSDTDTDHDINVTAGEARDAADGSDLTLSTETTKQIDAAWAAGDDAGGLDTGAVAADTVYAVWLISKAAGASVDVLISLSFTAPTMPTDYTLKRLVGFVWTDASSNIRPFTQNGDWFFLKDPFQDLNDATITSITYETWTATAPPNSIVQVAGQWFNAAHTAGQTAHVQIRPSGGVDTGASTAHRMVTMQGTSLAVLTLGATMLIPVDGSSQVDYAAQESADTTSLRLDIKGAYLPLRSNP